MGRPSPAQRISYTFLCMGFGPGRFTSTKWIPATRWHQRCVGLVVQYAPCVRHVLGSIPLDAQFLLPSEVVVYTYQVGDGRSHMSCLGGSRTSVLVGPTSHVWVGPTCHVGYRSRMSGRWWVPRVMCVVGPTCMVNMSVWVPSVSGRFKLTHGHAT